MVISSSCHLFCLLNWCFIATMTSVKEKNHGSPSVVATPLPETHLPVATQHRQEGLASLQRYLQHITNCIQKLETASEPLPQGRTGPVAVLRGKLKKCLLQVWTDLSQAVRFSHPALQCSLQSSLSVPSNNAHPQSVGQLNYAARECAQLNAVNIIREMRRIHLYFHVCQLFTG